MVLCGASTDFGLWSDGLYCFYIVRRPKVSSISFSRKLDFLTLLPLEVKKQLALSFSFLFFKGNDACVAFASAVTGE